jgi:1-phosphofructokinase
VSEKQACRFATVTLAPAIDCTLQTADELMLDRVIRAGDEICTPGGKGLNVAKQLVACGASVRAAGLLGHDAFGLFHGFCAEAGIAFAFAAVNHETRRNIMVTDGRHELKINRQAYPDLPFSEELLNRCIESVGDAELVVLSGTIPFRWPSDTYARLVSALKARGIRVALDTSGPALVEAVRAGPELIKPNREECEMLVGHPLPDGEAALAAVRSLSGNGMTVILSDGPRGAWFAQGGSVLFCTAPQVEAIDSTAAGDFMLGQFCHGLAGAGGLNPDAARRAVAVGSAAAELAGSCVPSQARVDSLLRRVDVRSYAG